MPANLRKDTIRKRLLRGLVDENLDTINGRPCGSLRRLRERRRARSHRILMTALVLVVAGGSLAALIGGNDAIHLLGATALDRPPQPAPSRIAMPAPSPSINRFVERLGFAQPEPIVPALIPVQVGRIALDPGHGGIDGGTSMGYGLLEKDLTLDIAVRLKDLLAEASWEVILTREDDQAVSLRQRSEIANLARADLFLSIHINWLPDRTARGFETYYLGPTDDPFLRRLATQENRDSGFALADYRELLEGIYADVRHDQSRQLALHVQRRLVETLRQENPLISSRGVMTAPLAVLVATEMPAVLVEVACLSNDREARLLALPRYRQRIAEALFGAVTEYAASINPSTSGTEKGS